MDPLMLRAITHALTDPSRVLAAIAALRGRTEPEAIQGLIEVVIEPLSAKAAQQALYALEPHPGESIDTAIAFALTSEQSSIRLLAAQILHRRNSTIAIPELRQRLRTDSSWPVRRASLHALKSDDAILDAASDPHWRVRHSLIQRLIDDPKVILGNTPRIDGVRTYLAYRRSGGIPSLDVLRYEDESPRRCPFWDWDPAVMAHTLDQMGRNGRRDAIDVMPFLVGHEDERVRNRAFDTLRADGELRHFIEMLSHLDEPRSESCEAVRKWIDALDGDRREELAFAVLQNETGAGAIAWAISQVDRLFPRNEAPARLERLIGDPNTQPLPIQQALRRFVGPEVTETKPSMSQERAAELIRNPERESSWRELHQAAKIMKVASWTLEPSPLWEPPIRIELPPEPLTLTRKSPPLMRQLFPLGDVCPIGISGHYGLPVEGFARAFEKGVNLFFWEPNYSTLTEFSSRLSPSNRRSVHFVAGTFEADGKKIRKDVERALRQLRIERLSLFLIFWTQSWQRITPELLDTLVQMRDEGMIAHYTLSTHNRPLALEAMDEGWNPLMVRHNAAHRGAEPEIFPKASEKGVDLITFNVTCYGRLLQPRPGTITPSASDCYRYTLMQPAVKTSFTAPSTLEMLDENLSVLDDPTLPADRLEALLAHGNALYEDENAFRNLVRIR